ncbi:hypothetical protein N8878_05475 [Psychromonas sp.]|nr:hypothetical protein [Psychromonas sp.]
MKNVVKVATQLAVLPLVLISNIALAESCKVEKNNILAHFDTEISFNVKGQNKTEQSTFEFIRQSDSTVLYRYPSSNVSQLWHLQSNGFVKNVHYFDEFSRAIEYDSVDLPKESRNDWSGKDQIISQAFLNSLENKEKINACETHYHQEKNGETWNITWSNQYNLPLIMQHTKADKTVQFKLIDIKQNKEKVTEIVNTLNAYQGTDFADIGDNESDPFIRKMIHLGFIEHGASGFYDANGNTLEAESKHNH